MNASATVMKFEEGDKVRFKGDDVTYTVSYANNDSSVDLDQAAARSPNISYVPTRLLEPAPREHRVGDVYRGKMSGILYVVAQGVDDILGVAYRGRFSDDAMGQFHNTAYYELIQEGPKL